MKVDDQLVDKLAELSKLEFDSDAKREIKKDLTQMLKFIDKLNEIDTTGIEPLVFITEKGNEAREDIAHNVATREEALKNAPKTDGIHFMVPKVIEKN